jgi:hypothetical protein
MSPMNNELLSQPDPQAFPVESNDQKMVPPRQQRFKYSVQQTFKWGTLTSLQNIICTNNQTWV